MQNRIEDPSLIRVRIKNRLFLYNADRKQIIGFDKSLINCGFNKKGDYELYTRYIDIIEIESAYILEATYALYKNHIFRVVKDFDEEKGIITLSPFGDNFNFLCKTFKISPKGDPYMGYRYELEVNDSDVLDIWEYRMPLKGVKMYGPRKVYIKNSGIWSQPYVYGSVIDKEY